jgi:hypothetical protein
VTPLELKRSRAVHKSLTLRLGMLKQRLRKAVIGDDCIALDYTTGRCSLDGDADMSLLPHIIGERIRAKLALSDAERVSQFDACGERLVDQVFDGFLGDAMPIELVPFFNELGAALVGVAKDCVSKKLTPDAAWQIMAATFDEVATRDAITEFALAIGKSGLAGDEVDSEMLDDADAKMLAGSTTL